MSTMKTSGTTPRGTATNVPLPPPASSRNFSIGTGILRNGWFIAITTLVTILIAFFVLRYAFSDSDTKNTHEEAVLQQVAAKGPIPMLCGIPNPAPSWTEYSIPSSGTEWKEVPALAAPACSKIDTIETSFEAQCQDFDSGEWVAYDGKNCKRYRAWKLRSKSADSETIHYRFEPA